LPNRTLHVAACRRSPRPFEQAVDGCGADGQNAVTVRLAKLQSAM
jgi:hypothetical protein